MSLNYPLGDPDPVRPARRRNAGAVAGAGILRSKTFWGGVIASTAHALAAYLPHWAPALTVVESIGAAVAVAGGRQAIAKNGEGK